MRIRGGAQEKNRGGTGGPRTESGPENSAGGDDGADELGFEEFGDEIRHGHGAPTHQVENAVSAETADASAGLEKIPEILGRGMVDRGRGDGKELAEDAGDFFEGIGELRV